MPLASHLHAAHRFVSLECRLVTKTMYVSTHHPRLVIPAAHLRNNAHRSKNGERMVHDCHHCMDCVYIVRQYLHHGITPVATGNNLPLLSLWEKTTRQDEIDTQLTWGLDSYG